MTTALQFIAVEPGVRLAVDAAPASGRPAVLFSHSVGASIAMWDAVVARLGDDIRAIRYDTRGHGRSDVPPGPYSAERLGRDALAILDALDVRKAVFCGLSLGGLTGMWLGAHHPDRLDGLVLANTAPNFPPPQTWRDRAALVRRDGMGGLVEPTTDRWFTKAFQARDPRAVADVMTRFAATPPEGYAGACGALEGADLAPRLTDIACPVHVICGAHDPSTTPARGEEIVAAVPNGAMTTLDAAHISAVEAPDRFAAALRAFVAQVT